MSSFITRRQDICSIGIANRFFEIVKRFTNLGAPVLSQFYFYVEINNRLHIVLFNFEACIFFCPFETCKVESKCTEETLKNLYYVELHNVCEMLLI